LQHGIFGRLETMIAALWPQSTPEQRRLHGLVSYRLFLALLPRAMGSHGDDQRATVREMKAVLYRYWEPIIRTPRTSDMPEPDTRAPIG
jgi:Tetracyclin repressor-like, C-terminal domain